MNRSISMLAAMVLVTTAQVWAGEDNDSGVAKIQHESRQLLEQIKDYSAEQKSKAIEETADTLAKLDKHIDKLERRLQKQWSELDDATREERREVLDKLREQRLRLAEWYGSMKTSSDPAWEEMKEGFSDAYQRLTDAWEKATEKF